MSAVSCGLETDVLLPMHAFKFLLTLDLPALTLHQSQVVCSIGDFKAL